jgi:hypothetical protein
VGLLLPSEQVTKVLRLEEPPLLWVLELGPTGICRPGFRHNRQIEKSGIMPGILGIFSVFWAFFFFLLFSGYMWNFLGILPTRLWERGQLDWM